MISARVTAHEYKTLKDRAASEGKRLSDWTRETLRNSVLAPLTTYQQLVFQAMNTELIRLTLVAAQAGEDICSHASQEQLEKQARASAEAITDRWLGLTKVKKGVA